MSEFMMQKYLEINNWIESLKREEGQTLAEYALLLALIAIVVVAVVGLAGPADQWHLRNDHRQALVPPAALRKLERQPTDEWPTRCVTGQLSPARDISTWGGSLGCRPLLSWRPTPRDSSRFAPSAPRSGFPPPKKLASFS